MTTSRPLRILHVAQPTDAGVAVCVSNLVESQIEREWELTVACPPGGDLSGWIQSAGAMYLEWPATRQPGPSVIGEVRRLRHLVAKAAPDLIHLHSAKAGLAGRLAVRGRIPTVFQPHAWSFHAVGGPVRSAAVMWERIATRWTQALICVSADEQREGEQKGIRAAYSVIPNGIDLDRLPVAGDRERASARRALGVSNGPLVVCVGRLSRQKGQDVLIDAWAEVSRAIPEATLVLVGDGPALTTLERASSGNVLFPGWSSDPSDWYAASDLVVVASRWEAGASLVVMEAMATGRAVVATDVAGMREAVPDDALVPVEQPSVLARSVTERLRDPSRLAEEGRLGRETVERNYDRRRTATQVESLYEGVVSSALLLS